MFAGAWRVHCMSGDNNHTEWDALFSRYRLPPFIPPDAATALSWGLAGPNSGVPFHTHGAGYSEPVHGALSHCRVRACRCGDAVPCAKLLGRHGVAAAEAEGGERR